MDALPAPVLYSLAMASGVALLELLGWYLMSPWLHSLLPLRLPVPELPRVTVPDRLADFSGSAEYVTWRWRPAQRAVHFRRRVELGRKPYSMGSLRLQADGSWELAWAPFPFFSWVAIMAWLLVYLGAWVLPRSAMGPGFAVLAVVAFVAVISANLYLSRRAFLSRIWPELRRELLDWLG